MSEFLTYKPTLFDAGCKFGVHPAFVPAIDALNHVMIDADDAEINYLSSHYKGKENFVFLSRFLGNYSGHGEKVRLHRYKHPGGHSAFRPRKDDPYWSTLRPGSGDIVGHDDVLKESIDGVAAHFGFAPDFLKIDVEGAEVEVLEGATMSLDRSVVGVRVEVLLNSLYENCPPTFSRCDSILRKHGFIFLYFDRFASNAFRPFSQFYGTERPFGQLVGVDAIYVKDPKLVLGSLDPTVSVSAALFAILNGASDLSFMLLSRAAKSGVYRKHQWDGSVVFKALERAYAKIIFANQDVPGRTIEFYRGLWEEVFCSPFLSYGDYFRRFPLS